MTVLIASLFLPFTADFSGTIESSEALSSPSSLVTTLPQRPSSISVPQSTPGQGATRILQSVGHSELQEPFVPEKSIRPGNKRLPSSRSLTRLSSLIRAEVHSTGWGKGVSGKQPHSIADELPPVSVAPNFQQVRKHQDVGVISKPRRQQRPRGRTVSYEQQSFTKDNLNIVPSNISNSGLVSTIEAVSIQGLLEDKLWVGTLGIPTDTLNNDVKKHISERLELDFESVLISVEDNDINGHYEGYCKTVLWQHLHYQIPDEPKSKAFEDHSWSFYVRVNQAFADGIIKNWKKGDAIWVHDYHLLLVPGMLRKKLPDAKIGLFLHTAFPSSEIFRCIATRYDLLEGMLGANMIGFQSQEYIHHFFQTCSRLKNVETTDQGIILEDGRFVHANTFPMGIDITTLEHQRQREDVAQWIKIISEKYQGKRLLVSRDKLDGVRGVRQKLLAYEGLLKQYPEYADQTVLIQIATSDVEEDELVNRVGAIVNRLNSSHSSLAHQPVVFLRQDIDYSQWLALCHVAETLVVTSLREGMNLSGHEFIQCQDGIYGTMKHGPLIMSEFTGAASILKQSALLVNPWDFKQCIEAMRTALEMSHEERRHRWNEMRKVVAKHTAARWYSDCSDALDRAYHDHSVRDATAVPRLSVSALTKLYIQSDRRLLILDYDGTLSEKRDYSKVDLLQPSQPAIEVVKALAEDVKNIVYIMTARSWQELDFLFAEIPGIGMIAENGAFLRRAGNTQWTCACDAEHVELWKDGVDTILEYYAQRVAGSHIDEVNTALIFRYESAEDKEHAFRQAGECASHINDVCSPQGVHAVPIENGIRISEVKINKGFATSQIGDELIKAKRDRKELLPDFLLVIGDSREDEYVFEWASKMAKAGIDEVTTVTVGQRNTAASATIAQGVSGVISALRKLTTNDIPTSPAQSASFISSPIINPHDL